MSIFQTIFGNKPAPEQQQQQQQPAQGQQQQQSNPHVEANKTLPQNSGTPTPQATPGNPNPESPTDKYKDLWDTSTQQQQQQAPNFKIGQEQLQKVVSGLNFTQGIQQNDLQKIAQGGEEAVVALQSILNDFGKNVFAQSAHFSAHMTENGYTAAQKEISTGLPGVVRNHMAATSMYEANPKLRDPALQPLVGAMQQQFAAKFPNATPAEINNMVTEYFGTTVAGAFQKPEPKQQSTSSNQAVDFSSFL